MSAACPANEDRQQVPPPHEDLSTLMRAANRGDDAAYRKVLAGVAGLLRSAIRRGLTRTGRGSEDIEDIVQETLLAIHLKRHTWQESQPLEPWVRAIAHHKLVDHLRRRGFTPHVAIDDLAETSMVAAPESFEASSAVCENILAHLPERHRLIVQAMSIEGHSAREVGQRLGMSENHVRVTLHRVLRSLAASLRGEEA